MKRIPYNKGGREGIPGLACPQDHADLSALWQLSFHDSSLYVRNFLYYLAADDRTVVLRKDGHVVAALYLLPAELKTPDGDANVWYLYAAATHPDYRNKGHMAALLQFCRGLAKGRGIDLIYLLPADEGLYDYYSGFGFRTCFSQKVVTLGRRELFALAGSLRSGTGDAPENGQPADKPAYKGTLYDVRETALAPFSHICWDRHSLQYIFFEHRWCGGSSVVRPDGYALFYQEESAVRVKEICSRSADGYAALLNRLLDVDGQQYILELPAESPLAGQTSEIRRHGMALPVTENGEQILSRMKNAYIGLALD